MTLVKSLHLAKAYVYFSLTSMSLKKQDLKTLTLKAVQFSEFGQKTFSEKCAWFTLTLEISVRTCIHVRSLIQSPIILPQGIRSIWRFCFIGDIGLLIHTLHTRDYLTMQTTMRKPINYQYPLKQDMRQKLWQNQGVVASACLQTLTVEENSTVSDTDIFFNRSLF